MQGDFEGLYAYILDNFVLDETAQHLVEAIVFGVRNHVREDDQRFALAEILDAIGVSESEIEEYVF